MENKGLKPGKIYRVGNFTIKKYTKTFTAKQMKQIRDDIGIPKEIQKELSQTGFPFIKVETISGSWCVQWAFGMTFYDAINEMPVNKDGEFYGVALENLNAILICMFADTATVGDMEYMERKQKLLHEYVDRVAKKGELTEEEVKESEEAANEVFSNEQHKETLLNIAKEVKDGSNE